MSEIKLNLIDKLQVLHGNTHGSIGDAIVAALSAEPESIAELEAAMARYAKPSSSQSRFAFFQTGKVIDEVPWDAGIVVIDLAARIVAIESTYSQPGREGEVQFHDGTQSTDISVLYRVPDDWLFTHSLDEYRAKCAQRRRDRATTPPLDARAILYGRPLLEWIVENMLGDGLQDDSNKSVNFKSINNGRAAGKEDEQVGHGSLAAGLLEGSNGVDATMNEVTSLHVEWLMTPREDLRNQSPRDVLLAKTEFIDFDMHTRQMQWTMRDEGPPCLEMDSFAFQFAGFGTHEWVIYYDLVRYLLVNSFLRKQVEGRHYSAKPSAPVTTALNIKLSQPTVVERNTEDEITRLDELKDRWLEQPQADYDGRIPAVLIENERKRLPIALSPRDMIIDDDCPTCQMLANDTMLGVGFWGLDGSQMDDDFAFSHHRTREEWEAERREWAEFSEKFNREWEEKQARISLGELPWLDEFLNTEDPF